MTAPEQPYGPGALCDDCGHMAFRHDENGCHGVFPERGCQFGGRGTEKNPKQCKGMLWMGVRWTKPWDANGYVEAKEKVK